MAIIFDVQVDRFRRLLETILGNEQMFGRRLYAWVRDLKIQGRYQQTRKEYDYDQI